MYHLPNELIDYIFRFDCNQYNKRNFNAVLRELNHLYSWKRTQAFLSYKYNTYDIYYEYNVRANSKTALTMSQYILWVSKLYSDCVIVDSMKWKLRKK
jgi:hypothetical protein